MSIPRIIHQFFGRGWDAVPHEAQEEISALRLRNPGWEYRFYDASNAERFILERYGKTMLNIYLSIDSGYAAARADLFRYLVCYSEGGLYLDVKSAAAKPLDSVFSADTQFVLSQWGETHPEIAHVEGGEYAQWFIASAPGHPFLSTTIEKTVANIQDYNPFRDGNGRFGVLSLTGPIAYTLAIHPILDKHPHEYRDIKDDLGFVYSIYGDGTTHRTKLGNHYSRARRSIIRNKKPRTLAYNFWQVRIRPLRNLVVWKFHGAMRRIGGLFR